MLLTRTSRTSPFDGCSILKVAGMKQSIKPDWQPDKCAVVHDIGHNPSVRGSHKGGLIDPIDRMTLNLPKAQQQLFVLLIESNNSKSDHLPDDKRVASRSIAARPAELTICEPARRSVGHPDNGSSGTDPNDGPLHDGPHRTLSLDECGDSDGEAGAPARGLEGRELGLVLDEAEPADLGRVVFPRIADAHRDLVGLACP